ncbi:response regulator [bacterium]|nr:response regulator [bacterium]
MIQILVVDDDEDTLMLMSLYFQQTGAQVVSEVDSQIAYKRVLAGEKAPFDLIVTDIFMPNLNGYQFAEQVRGSGFTGALIALTCNFSEEGREQGLAIGFDDYFDKTTLSPQLVREIYQKHCPTT